MCGIVGYIGNRNAQRVVLDGLKNLEYRGYDSWGIASLADNRLTIVKEVGSISEAPLKLLKDSKSTMAISHTRWATHGGVTKINAHPHQSGDIVVVHNGIIENYQELKKKYKIKPVSETDTEIAAHLIEKFLDLGFEEAFKKTFRLLEGSNALVAMKIDEKKIVAARTGSPLIVGVGKNEYFISSDVLGFINFTKNVLYLDPGEMVVMSPLPKFFNLETGKQVQKRLITIPWDPSTNDKGDYQHFMIKEIFEQKKSMRNALKQDGNLKNAIIQLKKAKNIFLTGCGTASKVCLFGEYMFSKVAGKISHFTPSSEFIGKYGDFLGKNSVLITVSQSGETADVLEVIKYAKSRGSKIISILNALGSSMERISDYPMMINAGPEQGVASTKATTGQLSVMSLLAYGYANKLEEGKRILEELAGKVNDMLNPRYEERIRKIAESIISQQRMMIIGKNLNYPIAQEASIKFQEVGYQDAHAFAGGELKHGPLALVQKDTPCLVLVSDELSILNNAKEVEARGGNIIGISPKDNTIFNSWIKIPDCGLLTSIAALIPIQMLSYHMSILRNINPDKPRNLAKSVTVK